jgi:hypothetical protein
VLPQVVLLEVRRRQGVVLLLAVRLLRVGQRQVVLLLDLEVLLERVLPQARPQQGLAVAH